MVQVAQVKPMVQLKYVSIKKCVSRTTVASQLRAVEPETPMFWCAWCTLMVQGAIVASYLRAKANGVFVVFVTTRDPVMYIHALTPTPPV